MKNKLTKILGIAAAGMAALLCVVTAAIVAGGGSLREAFDLGTLFHNSTEASSELPAAPSGDEPSSEPGSSEDVDPTEVFPEEPGALRIGVRSLTGQFNPFYASEDGDKAVVSLTQLNLLTYDRAGKVIPEAIKPVTRSFQGRDYLYKGISDITWNYDAEEDITSYYVTLDKDICFSDGIKMNADDLIFNYYVRLQPSYEGQGRLRAYDIVGLTNYYYNNNGAEHISVSDEEVMNELYAPSEEVQAYIRKLITDTLEEEKKNCDEIWQVYQMYGYCSSAQELFFKLYGIDLNYNPLDKTLDQVCSDVIASYGLDYRRFAENYAVDSAYFDEQIQNYVRELLLYNKRRDAEGKEVDNITGITKTNYYTVRLRVYGEHGEEALTDLFDIDILPLHIYGDYENYDYYNHNFGLIPGGYTKAQEVKTAVVGAGPYVMKEYKEGAVLLEPNMYYYGGEPGPRNLMLLALGNNGLNGLMQGKVDIVEVDGSKDIYEAICMANGNHKPSGDNIYTESIDLMGYGYIGMNANKVKVGDDPRSEASVALRNALGVIFSVYRKTAYSDYYGEAAEIIDYPVSSFFGIAPEKDDPAYQPVFSLKADGTPIYTDSMSNMERYEAAKQAAKEYLIKAGYVFDETSGQFTAAPEGGSMLFEVMINSDETKTHPSFYVLDFAKAALDDLGITLDIRYMATEASMLVSLYMGDAAIWCASWNTLDGPEFATHYQGAYRENAETPNIYGIADDELDSLLFSLGDLEGDELLAAQRKIMEIVRSWAIEVPCCQLHRFILYSSGKINVDSLSPDHTYFWGWLKDIPTIEVYYE